MKIDICTQFFGGVDGAKVLNLVNDDENDENEDDGNDNDIVLYTNTHLYLYILNL